MRRSPDCLLVFLVVVMLVSAPGCKGGGALRVAVFSGHGAVPGCVVDTVEALRIDPEVEPVVVTASEISTGILDGFDVLVFAGGGGSRQVNNLGAQGVARVRDFVMGKGKGVVGICAGAYMLTATPDYKCLGLCGVEAIDREHDERGHGIIAFSLTGEGREVFPELAGVRRAFVYYYEGPLCVPARAFSGTYLPLATILSDVHLENDAPAGLMPGKPLLMAVEAGRGRVFLSVGHPETTPGMRWIVPRMARWVARRDRIPYPDSVVRPHLYTGEILFDKKRRALERALFQKLLYGSAEERIEATGKLVEIRSWAARQWITGLLRDHEPAVRQTAARALADIEYTAAIGDLRASVSVEKDEGTRAVLEDSLERLRRMVGR